MDYFLDIFVEKMYIYLVFIKYRWGKFLVYDIVNWIICNIWLFCNNFEGR